MNSDGVEMRFVHSIVRVWFLGLLLILGGLFWSVPDLDAEAQGAIHFSHELERVRELAESTDRPIVILFRSTASPTCRKLYEQLLQSPELKAWSDKALWVDLDPDGGYFPASEFKIQTLPTLLIEDPKGERIHRIEGRVDPEKLAGLLESVSQRPSEDPANPEEDPSLGISNEHDRTPKGSDEVSNVGFGPLHLRSQSGFQSLRLVMTPRAPFNLQEGEWQAFGSLAWSNLWAVEEKSFHPAEGELGPYVIDGEILEGNLALSYGLSDTLEIELGYEVRSRSGGILDGMIEGFHDLVGIGQQGRDLWPRNEFHFLWAPEGELDASLGSGDSGIFVQNLLVTLQKNISYGNEKWPAVAVWITGRVGLESDAFRGRPVDGMLGLALAKRYGDFNVYLNLTQAWYNKSRALGVIELDTTQRSVMSSLEWRYHRKSSLVVQLLLSGGVVKNVPPFNQSSKEVIIGMKHEISGSSILEWGIIENLSPFENSPDIGFHFGFTRKF